MLVAGLFNVGSALSTNYAQHMIMRVFENFFLSPGIALGPAVVVECFFKRERAAKMVSLFDR